VDTTTQKKNFKNNILKINLQLFADEKTEKATPKKKSDARKKGQVLQSRDVGSAVVLVVIFVLIDSLGSYMYQTIAVFAKDIFIEKLARDDIFEIGTIIELGKESIITAFKIAGPIILAALAVGVLVSYLQVGYLFTVETLMPKLEKLNPISGMKRLFSVRSLVELAKSLIKLVIIGYVAYTYISDKVVGILQLMNVSLVEGITYIFDLIFGIAIKICIALVIIAILDYLYQWWQHEKDLKMSIDEVKREMKQTDGNPEIKGKIKQKQREASMRRMLTDVPQADVVVTNPTHYAVALKYDRTKEAVPIVIAKGADFLAFRIKQIAKDSNIEIVENKILARSLYDTCDVGKTIPTELYQAVAEVLAYIYSLKSGGKVV
jgi:flagellar biosynthetic protein FlhB